MGCTTDARVLMFELLPAGSASASEGLGQMLYLRMHSGLTPTWIQAHAAGNVNRLCAVAVCAGASFAICVGCWLGQWQQASGKPCGQKLESSTVAVGWWPVLVGWLGWYLSGGVRLCVQLHEEVVWNAPTL